MGPQPSSLPYTLIDPAIIEVKVKTQGFLGIKKAPKTTVVYREA
jgi:hypothetical protein